MATGNIFWFVGARDNTIHLFKIFLFLLDLKRASLWDASEKEIVYCGGLTLSGPFRFSSDKLASTSLETPRQVGKFDWSRSVMNAGVFRRKLGENRNPDPLPHNSALSFGDTEPKGTCVSAKDALQTFSLFQHYVIFHCF